MRRALLPILTLVLLCRLAAAGEPETAPAETERGRSLGRILDFVLTPGPEVEGDRTLLLLLDATDSLKAASFAAELDSALTRNAKKLGETKIGVARVGAGGRPALAPTDDLLKVAQAVRSIADSPEKKFQNVYADVRRMASAMSGAARSRDLVLVSLENGDAEDDVEATVAALRRSGVRLLVVAREAWLSDTYWISHQERPPRGMSLAGADSAFVEVPWGWLFQQTDLTEAVSSGFAMYGLSRLAAGSDGKVFLFYPKSSTGHRCVQYGVCPFCAGDHAPRGRAYQSHRLRALAPSAKPRWKVYAAAGQDPYYQAVLRAWSRASKAGLVRSRPSMRHAGASLKPEKRQLGNAATLGGSLSFGGQASKADRLAASALRIAADLETEIHRAEAAGGMGRYRAIAELTRVMLHLTWLNLRQFAAFCREVGPELVERMKEPPEPPEVPMYGPEYRYIGIGFQTMSLCHGVRPFQEIRLPGGEATGRDLAALEEIVAGFLTRRANTPFAEALRKSGIARFHFTVRGKYTPPPPRRPRSEEEDDTTTDRDRPTRGGSGDGSGGTPTSGG